MNVEIFLNLLLISCSWGEKQERFAEFSDFPNFFSERSPINDDNSVKRKADSKFHSIQDRYHRPSPTYTKPALRFSDEPIPPYEIKFPSWTRGYGANVEKPRYNHFGSHFFNRDESIVSTQKKVEKEEFNYDHDFYADNHPLPGPNYPYSDTKVDKVTSLYDVAQPPPTFEAVQRLISQSHSSNYPSHYYSPSTKEETRIRGESFHSTYTPNYFAHQTDSKRSILPSEYNQEFSGNDDGYLRPRLFEGKRIIKEDVDYSNHDESLLYDTSTYNNDPSPNYFHEPSSFFGLKYSGETPEIDHVRSQEPDEYRPIYDVSTKRSSYLSSSKKSANYPTYYKVPETDFDCGTVPFRPGMYADVETGCQVKLFMSCCPKQKILFKAYHVCNDGRDGKSGSVFLCPNATLFNQETFNCDHWFNVDCSIAQSLYILNNDPEKNPYVQALPKHEDDE